MLPLLRRSLILLAGLSCAQAQEDTAASGVYLGVGYAPEYFHWHETSADQLIIEIGGVKYAVGYGPDHRFVTENGWRHGFRAVGGVHVTPILDLEARLNLVFAKVDYEGGSQFDSLVPVVPAQSYVVNSGQAYPVQKALVVPMTTVTGYKGAQFDLHGIFQVPVEGALGIEVKAGASYRTLIRMLSDVSPRPAGSYDEDWDLAWAELGLGPFWKTREGRFGANWTVLNPLSTSETIGVTSTSGSSEIVLEPKANLGWRAGIFWKRRQGLNLELSYEKRTFDASEMKVVGSGRYIGQPFSYESLGRLEATWIF